LDWRERRRIQDALRNENDAIARVSSLATTISIGIATTKGDKLKVAEGNESFLSFFCYSPWIFTKFLVFKANIDIILFNADILEIGPHEARSISRSAADHGLQ